ncbi:hypothetical protein V8E51_010195 [Hyaloscypha variabilis]|uniref:DUF2415 domain-containing protein n=1 Tax=Hyaloscypha variabilis (strain UAMH 11265 / GT02V1 / F) TaxID=1149755 RepID=A0A2J6S9A3_HYAVF|nr:hypothetical protein L207DRAFT_506344 [Hyaloscypha variabilis F]
MAVKEESLHHATQDLILPKPRKYYRATIETEHWQLRSLVSSPEKNIVYFPSGTNVVALNTKTREREIIAKLSFKLKCLTASKDWLCCGGDKGEYTAVCLDDSTSISEPTSEADPDARLPLDLDVPHRASLFEGTSSTRRSRGHRPVVADVIKVGTEIVNCITLWSPGQDTSRTAYKVPVAVVSNNDCTVSILNVKTSETLDKLTMPDFVNRSVLSPDGTLLATICDDPFLYIHQRKRRSEVKKDRHGKSGPDYDWALAGRIQLEGQQLGDKSSMRGSFAACFSRSGKYLAIATQYGLISIFDVEILPDPGSLLVVFTSSRPGRESGAIRAMEFSPGPFDLLAWTEASGRVGVADVRTLFLSRQRLDIDSHGSGVERIIISDRAGEPVIDPRLRSFRTDSPSAPDYLGFDLERRQLRHLTREMLDRHQAPLTAEELEVLQAHRIARRQRDVANAAREAREALAEASATLRLGSWADGQRSANVTSTADTETAESSDRRISTAGLPAALREFVNPTDRTAASIRTFINERNRENERRNRSSMILAAAENAIEQETLGSGTPSSLERLTLTAPRIQAFGSDSPNNPWAEIDALYRSRYPDPPLDRTTRLRIEIENEDRRDFAHRLRQPWRPLDDHSDPVDRRENDLRDVVIHADETMGCCWSEDGRILYIGAKDGIHEFHVNLAGRKIFPSLVLR